MPNRTPSFIVVGLVIIMFLLGFFYMSCSSTTGELRQTLAEFEERIRMLTIKNNENEKKIETMNTSKRELEEEKINIQKQMEKKDSEVNDLNTKLNEKNSELLSLKSDKQVLEEQLKQYKNMSDNILSKGSTIEKLQQEYNEQKKSSDQQINDLKQQLDNYKQKLNQSQEKQPVISNQRFPPILSSNETNNNLPQQSSTNLSTNVSNQVNNAQQLVLEPAGQGQNNSDVQQRFQRSLNDTLFDNKILNETEVNNKTQFNIENAQKTVNLTSILSVNGTDIVDNPSQLVRNDVIGNHPEAGELH